MAEFIAKIHEFIVKCARVWAVTRKPTNQEFKATAQSAGIGLLLAGLLGFLIALIVRVTILNRLV